MPGSHLVLVLRILFCWLAVLAPAAAFEQKLVIQFSGGSGKHRGTGPVGKLVDDGKGYLWGVTKSGGKYNLGTIFKVRRSDGAFFVVKDFNGKLASPEAGLVKVGDYMWGTLPGENNFGFPTALSCGAIYKVSIQKGTFTKVFEFGGSGKSSITSLGCNPRGCLVKDKSGKLWGVASGGSGPTRFGTIFRLDPKTGRAERMIAFTGTTGAKRGMYPVAGLTPDKDGVLWGVTSIGGLNDLGTVFKVNPVTKAFKTMVEFGGSKAGQNPASRLLVDTKNGVVWGTTGTWPTTHGTVFWYDIKKSSFGHYFSFTDYSRDGFPGSTPHELMMDGEGGFWGTTRTGGHPDYVGWHGCGVVYRIDLQENTVAYQFYFQNQGTGLFPTGGLTRTGDGRLWGLAEQGGLDNYGVIYTIRP